MNPLTENKLGPKMNFENKIKYSLSLASSSVLAFSAFCFAEEKADYSAQENWLCRGADSSLNACDVNNSTTIVAADGNLTSEAWTANPEAPIDCFYVYPTVSQDASHNSDLKAGPEEFSVVHRQFARFASHCRVFAPMYRQVTLSGLRSGLAANGEVVVDAGVGADDVLDAWNYYLEHYNNGRGIVLVGHSQGSMVMAKLIPEHIEGKPIEKQIISAMLMGSFIQVPKNKLVGATFKKMPLCTAGDQLGCVITYPSFRSTVPPQEGALFGRNTADTQFACTNPAVLAKGNNQAHAYLNSAPVVNPWTDKKPEIETPFVSLPGLLTTQCVTNDSVSYLEVTVNGDSADSRVDDISGDMPGGWGFHLLDMNIGMGDFLTIVEKQTQAYLAKSQ